MGFSTGFLGGTGVYCDREGMMPLFLIAYDLKDKESPAYKELDKRIGSLEGAERIQESVWVFHGETPISLVKQLWSHGHEEDKLFIAEISGTPYTKPVSWLLRKHPG
jgi:hypothetical protein